MLVQARATGRRRPLVPDRDVPVGDGGAQTLRALIERVVREAVAAFEDGLYLVLIDGEQQRDLDAQVLVYEETTLTFLRLVALAGG